MVLCMIEYIILSNSDTAILISFEQLLKRCLQQFKELIYLLNSFIKN